MRNASFAVILRVMKKKTGEKQSNRGTISCNNKARYRYFLQERIEAGLVLEGWEVKSLRAGRVQLSEAYVLLKGGEAWLSGALITAMPSAGTHIQPQAARSRKLLLHRKELARLIGAVERKGAAIVPTAIYWKNGRVKLEIALAQGRKLHDRRHSEKERDWQRQRSRLLRRGSG